MGRGAVPLQTPMQDCEPFLAPGNPRIEWGDACIANSKCGRINALYKGRKMLGVRVARDRFRLKKHSPGLVVARAALSSAVNPIF